MIPEDMQPPFAGNLAVAQPEFAIARAIGKTAVYKRTDRRSEWSLVLTETGDAEAVITALRATGATVTVFDDMLHLLVHGDAFPERLPAFAAPTAATVLRAEVALLRKQAENKRIDAAYGDLRHDNGARVLDARADALEHAIAVFDKHGR